MAGLSSWSCFGAALGLPAGLTLGAVLAVAWRRGTPEPHRARPLGRLARWLVVAAALLLTVALSWPDSGFVEYLLPLLVMVILAALLLYWLVSEAESLARWRRFREMPLTRAAGVRPSAPEQRGCAGLQTSYDGSRLKGRAPMLA